MLVKVYRVIYLDIISENTFNTLAYVVFICDSYLHYQESSIESDIFILEKHIRVWISSDDHSFGFADATTVNF